MIEVVIWNRDNNSSVELGRISIENVSTEEDPDLADYAVKFGVERIGSVGVHERALFSFPRKQFNCLALVRQALMTLEPNELKLDGDYDKRDHKVQHMLGLIRRPRR